MCVLPCIPAFVHHLFMTLVRLGIPVFCSLAGTPLLGPSSPVVLLLLLCLFFTSSFFPISESVWSKQIEVVSLPLLTKDKKKKKKVITSFYLFKSSILPKGMSHHSHYPEFTHCRVWLPRTVCLHLNELIENSKWIANFYRIPWNQIMPPFQGKTPSQIIYFIFYLQ